MPVDEKALSQLIADVAGDDTELATVLKEKLSKNANAAERFSGGFLRQSDYTTKTQALASDRKKLEDQVTQYEQALEQADKEKDAILKDLAKQKLTTSQAETLLEGVKAKYRLEDSDIPGMSELVETRKTGKVPESAKESIDIDAKLNALETKLLKSVEDKLVKTLIPEMSGMAALDVIWDDINYEHQQLFGKRLTRPEKLQLIEQAKKDNTSIEKTWESKFGVSTKRSEVHDAEIATKAVENYKAEEAKRRTDEVSGIREKQFEPAADAHSIVLRKNFREGRYAERAEHEEKPGQAAHEEREPIQLPYRDAEGRVERVMETHTRRRAAGLGYGQPEPERKAG
jgi:hypothetical protein